MGWYVRDLKWVQTWRTISQAVMIACLGQLVVIKCLINWLEGTQTLNLRMSNGGENLSNYQEDI